MWKKKVEILFQGPLTGANDAVKCNYIIYWSGKTGMAVDGQVGDRRQNYQCQPETEYNNTLTYLKNTSHRNQML